MSSVAWSVRNFFSLKNSLSEPESKPLKSDIEAHTELRPIEHIRVGDYVWSWNEKALKPEYQRINKLFLTPNQRLFRIVFRDRQGETATIDATEEHPFWVHDKGWVPLNKIEPGDSLLLICGEVATVDEVKAIAVFTDVFNIEVHGAHNYFVQKKGVLVHNSSTNKLSEDAEKFQLALKIQKNAKENGKNISMAFAFRVASDEYVKSGRSNTNVADKSGELEESIDAAVQLSALMAAHGPEDMSAAFVDRLAGEDIHLTQATDKARILKLGKKLVVLSKQGIFSASSEYIDEIVGVTDSSQRDGLVSINYDSPALTQLSQTLHSVLDVPGSIGQVHKPFTGVNINGVPMVHPFDGFMAEYYDLPQNVNYATRAQFEHRAANFAVHRQAHLDLQKTTSLLLANSGNELFKLSYKLLDSQRIAWSSATISSTARDALASKILSAENGAVEGVDITPRCSRLLASIIRGEEGPLELTDIQFGAAVAQEGILLISKFFPNSEPGRAINHASKFLFSADRSGTSSRKTYTGMVLDKDLHSQISDELGVPVAFGLSGSTSHLVRSYMELMNSAGVNFHDAGDFSDFVTEISLLSHYYLNQQIAGENHNRNINDLRLKFGLNPKVYSENDAFVHSFFEVYSAASITAGERDLNSENIRGSILAATNVISYWLERTAHLRPTKNRENSGGNSGSSTGVGFQLLYKSFGDYSGKVEVDKKINLSNRSVKIRDSQDDVVHANITEDEVLEQFAYGFNQALKYTGKRRTDGEKIFDLSIAPRVLFRGSVTGPDKIFNSGFTAKGASTNYLNYLSENQKSVFISTSKSSFIAYQFAVEGISGSAVPIPGYVYALRSRPHYLDANSLYKRTLATSREVEQSAIHRIPAHDIIGVFNITSIKDLVSDGRSEDFMKFAILHFVGNRNFKNIKR